MDVNKFRQLNKQLNSEVSAEDTSFMTSRQQQASNNDPIYISSPSHGAGRSIDTGDPSLSPSDTGKLSGGKRWAKVKGVFGALGKFRKSAKQSDAVVTSPRPTPTPARTTHSLSVDQQAATVQLVSSVAGETEQQPTLQSSNAISQISGVAESPSTAPSTAVVSSDTSPLRTSAIEPTSRVASLRTSDPVDEETPLGTGDLTSGPAAPKEIVSPPVCQADQNIAVPLPVSSVPSSPACDGGGHLNLMISEKGREESAHKVRLSAEAYVERSKSKRAFWPGALSHVEQRSKLPLNEHLKSRTLHDQSISLCMGECLPSTWHGRYGTSIRKCHGKRYTELHSADPKSRHERIALRNVTEIEAREIVRRRKLAADSVFREHLRLELERHVCLELDNLERQRARIQAIEAEEEERWRRIEENYIHASTPQRLQAEHKEGLEEILQAEANERTRRMVEDGKQFVSIRYLYVDKFRKSINTELSKFVWPGVESCAPAGVQEVLIPRSRSRQDPASVLYFCVSQRKLLQFPKGELFALEQDLQVNRLLNARTQEGTIEEQSRKKQEIVPSSPNKVQAQTVNVATESYEQEFVKNSQRTQPKAPMHKEEPPALTALGWFTSLQEKVSHLTGDLMPRAPSSDLSSKESLLPRT